MLYQSYKQESRDDENDKLELLFWCMSSDNNPLLLRIKNFKYSFYIYSDEIDVFHKIITDKKFILNRSNKPDSVKIVQKTYFYNFNREKPFIEMKFDKKKTMYKWIAEIKKNKIKDENGTCVEGEIYEEKVPIVLKYFAEIGFSASNWFECEDKRKIEGKKSISYLDEYLTDYRNIKKPENKYNAICKPLTMSYDIECYSPNARVFPSSTNMTCQITMISCVFERLGDKNSRESYIIYIGEKGIELENNAIGIACPTEKVLIEMFFEMIRKKNPILLTGYNIGHFDNDYIYYRAAQNGVDVNIPSLMKKKSDTYFRPKLNNSFANKSRTSYFIMDGRITIDVYDYVKKVQSGLERHTLDFVATKFLKYTKHDVTAADMFSSYENYRKVTLNNGYVPRKELLRHEVKWMDEEHEDNGEAKKEYERLANYCLRDSILPLDLMAKLFIWTSQMEMSKLFNVDVETLSVKGEQIKGFSQLYVILARNGYVLNVESYGVMTSNGGLVTYPKGGINKYVIALDFASLYPSLIIAYNICFITFVPYYLIESGKVSLDMVNVFEFDQQEADKLPDGTFPKKGTKEYKDTLHTVHYKYYFLKKEIKKGELPKLMEGLRTERKDIRKLIYKLDEEMKELQNNSDDKDILEKIKQNELLRGIYDAQQLTMKMSMNSIYGILNVSVGGMISFPHLAQTITATGRQAISKCNDYLSGDLRELIKNTKPLFKGNIEDEYKLIPKIFLKQGGVSDSLKKYDLLNVKRTGIINYNDTDSVYVNFDWLDPKDVKEFGFLLQYAFSFLFEKCLILEFEQALWSVIFISKKRYTGIVMNLDNGEKNIVKGELDLYTRGLVTAKKSAMRYQRNMLSELSKAALNDKTPKECLKLLLSMVSDLLNNRLETEAIIQCNKIKKEYKSKSFHLAKFGENYKSRGKDFEDMEVIDYSYCLIDSTIELLRSGKKRNNTNIKSGDCIYSLSEILEGSAPTIDVVFILSKISIALDQFFNACFGGLECFKSYKINKSRSKKNYDLTKPLEGLLVDLCETEPNIYQKFNSVKRCKKMLGAVADKYIEMYLEHVNKYDDENNEHWINVNSDDDSDSFDE